MKKTTILAFAALLMLSGNAQAQQNIKDFLLELFNLQPSKSTEEKKTDAETKPVAPAESAKPDNKAPATPETLKPENKTPATPEDKKISPEIKPAAAPETAKPETTKPDNKAPAVNNLTPAPAQIPVPAPVPSPKPAQPAVAAEIKPVSEPVSLSALHDQGWQISKINTANHFASQPNHWIFNFANTGKYKALGACNSITGSFTASNDGVFRLRKLETSHNECPESKDEETMVFNLLLMADSFGISNQVLTLKSGNKVLMEFSPNNQEIKLNIPHKTKAKKTAKSSKHGQAKETKAKETKTKEHRSKEAKKKASQENDTSSAKKSSHKHARKTEGN
ncbi:MAG: META domain-containing protein [Crocinitomicaceae bacterium]